jgi:hypothetical protein
MSATAKRQVVLQRLLTEGSLAESVCSRAFLRFVSSLISGSVLAWEKSGAGRRLAVRNASALANFLSQHFPNNENEVATMALRVQGAARFRDTKTLRGTGEEIVCVRGCRDGSLFQQGQPVSVVEPTRNHGLLAFLLRTDSLYELHGRIATVENSTVFTSFDSLNTGLSFALYARGCFSRRVLSWLARQAATGLEIIHFGDYDPVGLKEYLKLRAACGERVSLYLPEDLPALFRKYSNPKLLQRRKSQFLLQRLRKTEDRSVLKVIRLIEETNAGLEQETLLV